MRTETRPDPDALLAAMREQEPAQPRGKLKIFLGYAAGVGKTFAMLEAARQRKLQGMDVVVAYVETHGRTETEALLDGLELIPRASIEYRGVILPEMDIDAVLKRRPQLALVDELAHTNAPGSRHPKRVQDVIELLEAGIDVYTTLNVQHLESLNDVVAQITGVTVRETLPDSIIDTADEIELVDLPPDELLARLREGKVYMAEQAQRAIQKFFRKGNLTALRELALRRAAQRVDNQMHAYMQTRAIPGPWAATERLLVAVNSGALGEKLVRAARHLADELNAEWHVIYVETPEELHLSQPQQDQLARTLRLAEELGAQVQTLPAQSIVPALQEFARARNVTKIIAGKPRRPRWEEFLRGSTVDRLIRTSGKIDVYVISGGAEPAPLVREGWVPHRPLLRYAYAVLLVVAATLFGALISPYLSPTNLVLFYLLAVVIAAVYLGRGPAVLTSLLGVLAFDFLFVPPRGTFVVADAEYILTFLALFLVGLVVSQLAARVREQADAARQREQDSTTLYALSRELAVAADLDDVLRAVRTNAAAIFERRVVVFLPSPSTHRLAPATKEDQLAIETNELAVAVWAFEHGQPAGRDTDTLPAAKMRFMPLKTARGILGVIGVAPTDSDHHLSPAQRRLFEAFASLAAVAIERAQLADAARSAEVSRATEKLQTALLNSISHDLRTPLVSITGALTYLQEDRSALDEKTRQTLLENAREETERLNRLVGNLLDMTRLEADALHLVREPSGLEDVIGSALEQLDRRLEGRTVKVDVPSDLPLVPMDFSLIVQVLVNLIDNALKYSPRESPIEIRASVQGDQVRVQVMDRGVGIPAEDLPRVFDKFFRVQRPDMVSGTGMGLAICKGIVEAHGGTITAENRLGGGTLITFTLPLVGSQ